MKRGVAPLALGFVMMVAVVAALSTPAAARPAGADSILGRWLVEKKNAIVDIFKVGDKFDGKIVWLSEPKYPDTHKPKVDKNNPDAKLRTRPIIGMHMLTNFEYHGDNVWEAGQIYDPESGKTYKCKITWDPDKADQLNVRGFIGVSLFGRTETWTRSKK